jgi:signal transduction histidine kinase
LFISEENYLKSLSLGLTYNEGDVIHYNFSGLIKTNLKNDKVNSVLEYIDKGQEEELLKNTSKIALTEFYETSIMALQALNKSKEAIEMMNDFYLLNKQQRDRELYHQTTILNRYFDNNRDLILSNAANSIKEKEIDFSRKMLITLTFFFITFIIGAYFVFQNRKNKERIKTIEVENEILKLKKDNEIKAIIAKSEAIDQERNRLARELHDDIGSSMSSVQIYADVALNELEKNPEKAKKIIQKQTGEIAQINENISDLIWAIYSKNENEKK